MLKDKIKILNYFHTIIHSVVYISLILLCSLAYISKADSKDLVIKYRENGTPSYIKGSNLSSNLESDPEYVALKRDNAYEEMVFRYLEKNKEKFKINSPRSEFTLDKIDIDDLRSKHIKLHQIVDSIPVWGCEISIHLDNGNNVYLVQGNYEPTLKNVTITSSLSEKDASELAIGAVSNQQSERWKTSNILKYIFMVDSKYPRLAYLITLNREIIEKVFVFVDANNGKILHKLSGNYNNINGGEK